MFEFDEHFAELATMESEQSGFEVEDEQMLPVWAYVGHDVWKLAFDADALQVSHEWRLKTADVA